jgi:hypothetical protein
MKKPLLVLLVLCGLSASAIADENKGLQRTWDDGFFRVHESATIDGRGCTGGMVAQDTCYTKIDISRTHPVAIFVTDCNGSFGPSEAVSKFMITVVPSTSSRPNSRSNCRVDAEKPDKEGFFGLPFKEDRNAMELRFAEVRHAYAELMEMPWVDKNRIYLAGLSEGGAVAALYSGDRFAGKIILNWTCASRDPWWEGINGSPVPTLAIVGSDVRFNQHPDRNGRDCGEHFKDQPNSRSVVLKGRGRYRMSESPAGKKIIGEFIEMVNAIQ